MYFWSSHLTTTLSRHNNKLNKIDFWRSAGLQRCVLLFLVKPMSLHNQCYQSADIWFTALDCFTVSLCMSVFTVFLAFILQKQNQWPYSKNFFTPLYIHIYIYIQWCEKVFAPSCFLVFFAYLSHLQIIIQILILHKDNPNTKCSFEMILLIKGTLHFFWK